MRIHWWNRIILFVYSFFVGKWSKIIPWIRSFRSCTNFSVCFPIIMIILFYSHELKHETLVFSHFNHFTSTPTYTLHLPSTLLHSFNISLCDVVHVCVWVRIIWAIWVEVFVFIRNFSGKTGCTQYIDFVLRICTHHNTHQSKSALW